MNNTTKSNLAFVLAVLGMLVTGAVIGAVAGFLSNLIYIVFLFPLGMGLMGALILEKSITCAKIRGAARGVLLGCLMAIAIYAAFQAANYFFFRWQASLAMHQKIMEETGESAPSVANVLVDYALKKETGFSGFLGYLLYKDRQGVTIGRTFSSGLNLGPIFTWVFWLLEFAIISWVTVGVSRQAVGRRFCETCNRWYGKERHLGGVSQAMATALEQLLERRDFVGASELMERDAEVPSLEVYAQSCESCKDSDTSLELKRVSLSQNGRLHFKPESKMSIRPHERANLLSKLRLGAEA